MNPKQFVQTAASVLAMVTAFGSAQQTSSGAGVLVANNASITQVPHIALEDLLAVGGQDALLATWRAKTPQASKVQIQEVKATAKTPANLSSTMIDTQALDAAVLLEGDAALISQLPSLTMEEILELGGEEPMLLALKKMAMAK